ncbi:hypothetical protein TNCV_3135421 [Trichonephila clavipes]|nr:hypothetical protein TNCV_3135421 [Trichonephila clavipes]
MASQPITSYANIKGDQRPSPSLQTLQNTTHSAKTHLKRRHWAIPVSSFVVWHIRVATSLYGEMSRETKVMVTGLTVLAAANVITPYEWILSMLQICPSEYYTDGKSGASTVAEEKPQKSRFLERRKRRGRSKERRLRDSSPSSSPWSSDTDTSYTISRDPNRKMEVKIELEGGVPVRGWQAPSKRSEIKSKALLSNLFEKQNQSIKRTRASSSSSSSSKSPSKFRESKRSEDVDRKLKLKIKRFKSSIVQPQASTSRRKSSSPELQTQQRGRAKESSVSSSSSSDSRTPDSKLRKLVKNIDKKQPQTESCNTILVPDRRIPHSGKKATDVLGKYYMNISKLLKTKSLRAGQEI